MGTYPYAVEYQLPISKPFSNGKYRNGIKIYSFFFIVGFDNRYRIINRGEFTVILIGKDGGIKMKRDDQTRLMDILT